MKERLLDSGPPRPEVLPIELTTFNALVEPYLGPVVLVLAAVAAVSVLLSLFQARRIRRLERRLDRLVRGNDDRGLEGVLEAHLDKVYAVARELDELSARSAVLEANARRAFQRVGLVRFNPFEDTGGNQSFAIALLDGNDNGFVVSSLHARAGTRVYAKALSGGRSEAALSTEETEALRLAMGTPPVRADRAV